MQVASWPLTTPLPVAQQARISNFSALSMAQASHPRTLEDSPSPNRSRQRGFPWPVWMLLGFCFGLGYGFTQRLLPINPFDDAEGVTLFGVNPPPGTTLESLREQEGGASQGVRVDLDQLEGERQQKAKIMEEKELVKRREAMEKRERLEKELQQDRLRELVDDGAFPPISSPEPTSNLSPPLELPAPPSLPEIPDPPRLPEP